jgi:hypothetical protein
MRICLLLVIGLGLCLAGEIERQIVVSPRLGIEWLPDRRSQEAWRALFDPAPTWPTRDVAVLVVNHPQRLPTLWAARLLYEGEPWTRRENEPSSLRRWRAADREIKLAILRDLRYRRDPAFRQVLEAVLMRDSGDAGLAISALTDLWLLSREAGLAMAQRIADPRLPDRLPAAGLPVARTFALGLLLEVDAGAARQGLEWALLKADGVERLTALGAIGPATAPDLISGCILGLTEALQAGRLDDDGMAAAVMACARLGDAVGEATARALAILAASAPRELACAAAAALARIVTWKDAIAAGPLAERLARESDPAVRHALFAVLLRLAPDRVMALPGAAGWAELARHRKALSEWAWRRY